MKIDWEAIEDISKGILIGLAVGVGGAAVIGLVLFSYFKLTNP